MERSLNNNPKIKLVNVKENKSKVLVVGNVDYVTSLIVVLLVLIGIIMVFSASYYGRADMFAYLKKQAIVAVVGFIAMNFMSNFNYVYTRKFAFWLYLVANILLIVVLMLPDTTNGAKRWIPLFAGINLQPSEVAKAAIILFVPHIICKYSEMLRRWGGYIFVGCIIVVTVILIALGNLSTAIIATLIGFAIVFVASPYTRIFIIGGIASALSLTGYLVFAATGFRGARVTAWLDPFSDPLGKGFQTIQSLYAIASGGLFGLGLGQSRQKRGFIPEGHNDIIFAIVCEELGFFGAAMILLLFSLLIWRCIKIAINAPDLYGTLVATGIVSMVAVQVIINIAVVTNTIPNTGVPLPFISYGGTSLAILLFLMGIMLNISRYSKD